MQRIWFRTAESAWFLTIREDGKQKQLRLLRGENTREDRLRAEELAIQELSSRKLDTDIATAHSWITVDHVLDAFLRHSKENHEPATTEWYEWFFSTFGPANKSVRRYFDKIESLMNETAAKKTKATTVFSTGALSGLRKELDQARKEAGDQSIFYKRVAFLELGLRWTEIEARSHAFLTDSAKADKAAAKKVLDQRFALMRDVFQRSPLAVNVAYVSWGEDAQWARLGWARPRQSPKP
ncbi:MAG: hypothetical protein HYX68_05350 [Planctomycetes bacterium]|jgi:hypothetical protein|nr:hypothetical protein [Planctomycetota bacterium]